MSAMQDEDGKSTASGAPPSYEAAVAQDANRHPPQIGLQLPQPLPPAHHAYPSANYTYSNAALHPDDIHDDDDLSITVTPATSNLYVASSNESLGGFFPKPKSEIRRKPVPQRSSSSLGLIKAEKEGHDEEDCKKGCCATTCCSPKPVCCNLTCRGIICIVVLCIFLVIGGAVGGYFARRKLDSNPSNWQSGGPAPATYPVGPLTLPGTSPSMPLSNSSVSISIWDSLGTSSNPQHRRRHSRWRKHRRDSTLQNINLFYQDSEGYLCFSSPTYDLESSTNKTAGYNSTRIIQARQNTPLSSVVYDKDADSILRLFFVTPEDILADISLNFTAWYAQDLSKPSPWAIGELSLLNILTHRQTKLSSAACDYGKTTKPMVWVQDSQGQVQIVTGGQRPLYQNDWAMGSNSYGFAMPGTGLGGRCTPGRQDNFKFVLWDMQTTGDVSILASVGGPDLDTAVNVTFAKSPESNSTWYNTYGYYASLPPLSSTPLYPFVSDVTDPDHSRGHVFYVNTVGNLTLLTSSNCTLVSDDGSWDKTWAKVLPLNVSPGMNFAVDLLGDSVATVLYQDAWLGNIKAGRLDVTSGNWTDLGVLVSSNMMVANGSSIGLGGYR